MARSSRPYCGNAENHTPQPDGYLAWHAWAAKKIKTHKQIQCPGCGLLMIWVPKQKRKATAA